MTAPLRLIVTTKFLSQLSYSKPCCHSMPLLESTVLEDMFYYLFVTSTCKHLTHGHYPHGHTMHTNTLSTLTHYSHEHTIHMDTLSTWTHYPHEHTKLMDTIHMDTAICLIFNLYSILILPLLIISTYWYINLIIDTLYICYSKYHYLLLIPWYHT